MPKMKTNRAAAKRFKVTANGKVKISRSRRRHILQKKTRATKRNLRQPAMAHPSDMGRIERLIPYV